MKERWTDVIGFEGYYRVSSLGRVRTVTRRIRCRCRGGAFRIHTVGRRILRPNPLSSGHLMVRLYDGHGNGKDFGVHRLVLEAFAGPCPEGMECRHLDDVPSNNRLPNLCWGTPKENSADRKRNGNSHYTASPKGEEQYQAKLTEEKVRYIRKTYKDGTHTVNELAEMMGVKKITIYSVTSGKAWKHVI